MNPTLIQTTRAFISTREEVLSGEVSPNDPQSFSKVLDSRAYNGYTSISAKGMIASTQPLASEAGLEVCLILLCFLSDHAGMKEYQDNHSAIPTSMSKGRNKSSEPLLFFQTS